MEALLEQEGFLAMKAEIHKPPVPIVVEVLGIPHIHQEVVWSFASHILQVASSSVGHINPALNFVSHIYQMVLNFAFQIFVGQRVKQHPNYFCMLSMVMERHCCCNHKSWECAVLLARFLDYAHQTDYQNEMKSYPRNHTKRDYFPHSLTDTQICCYNHSPHF
ncbi:MAG: hypothetical protein AB2693_33375 [Candidatus Thiodiazotropha sp.]